MRSERKARKEKRGERKESRPARRVGWRRLRGAESSRLAALTHSSFLFSLSSFLTHRSRRSWFFGLRIPALPASLG